MKFHLLAIAAAAALTLGAFTAGPAEAAAIAPSSSAPISAASGGSLITEASSRSGQNYRDSRNYRSGRDYRRGPAYRGRPHWRGGPRWHQRRHASRCWQVRRVWTPYGFQMRRFWVCR
jgi:hypothetical protein